MGDNKLSKQYRISFQNVMFLLGIIFVAFNLRPSLTSVGPLISSIRFDLGISNTFAGLLTTLPLLMFGLFSVLAPKIGRKLGHEQTIFLALLVMIAGILFRSTGFVSALIIGTATLGLGIAICNVLLPGIIKNKSPHKIGLMTGIYTTAMSIMAALGSGITIPLAEGANLGWEKALGIWAILPAVTLIVWLPQLRKNNKTIKVPVIAKSSIWKSTLAWQVAFFMGFQSSIYYSLISWLPEILNSRGIDLATGGWFLTLMHFSGLPATLLIPIFASRMLNQRAVVISISILYFTSISGIYFGGHIAFITFFIFLLGIANGAGISLALILFGLRAKNAEDAANLSGMAQSCGYLLAAFGPFIMGYLFDLSHTWTSAFVMFILLSTGFLLSGLGASRNKYILDSEFVKERG